MRKSPFMVVEMDERMHENACKYQKPKREHFKLKNGSSSSIPMIVIETICFTLSYNIVKITQN